MHFLKSRLGLKVWLALWLLVALVPSWRLRAERQWRDFSPAFDSQLPGYRSADESGLGLTPNMAEEVARRFPNDVAAQLAPLDGHLSRAPDAVNADDVAAPLLPPLPKLDPKQYDTMDKKLAFQYFSRYDALERRFPAANEVRLQRLLDVGVDSLIKDEGPLSPQSTAQDKRVRVRQLATSPWLAKPELEAALHTAREGARRDPGNAFFAWMEAALLFALEQPNEAIRALDRAEKCARFDTGRGGMIRTRLTLLRRVRAVGWEDFKHEMYGVHSPPAAVLLSTTNAMVGRVRLARQRGNEARALEIAGVLVRAGGQMSAHDPSLFGHWRGEGSCYAAWSAAIEHLPEAPIRTTTVVGQGVVENMSFEEWHSRTLKVFVAYARKQGRDDLAHEAEQAASTFDLRRLLRPDSKIDQKLAAQPLALAKGFWLGAWLLDLALIGASQLCLASVLIVAYPASGGKRAVVPAVVGRYQAGTRTAPRSSTVLTTFFCVGATGVMLASLWTANAIPGEYFGRLADIPANDARGIKWNNAFAAVLVALWSVPLYSEWLWRQLKRQTERAQGTNDRSRIVLRAMWALFWVGALAASVFVLSPGRRWTSDQLALVEDYLGFAVWGWAIAVCVSGVLTIALAPRALRLARILSAGTLWFAVGTFILATSGPSSQDTAFLVGVFTLVLALVTSYAAREGNKNWLTDLGAAFENFGVQLRFAASMLTLSATIGYVAVAALTVPLEQAYQARAERELRIGEAAFLREQLANH